MGSSANMSTSNQYIKYSIEVTQNSQSTANNTSNVTVDVWVWRNNTGYTTYGTGTCYCKIDSVQYSASVSSSQKITSSPISLFSKTLNISHNSDGTKTLTCSAWISMDVLSSSEQSYSQGLTSIGRAATISDADNFTDEGNPRVWFSNPGKFKLRFILEVYGGGTVYATRDVSNPSSPYTFSLATSERNTMRSETTTSNTRQIGVVIQTFLNSSTPSNSVYVQRTLTITNAYPSFSSSQLSYKDSNSSVVAITGNDQQIVQNKSSFQYTFTSATAQKYASISSYQVKFNGSTSSKSSSGTYSIGTVNSSSNLTLQIKAIDSRGNSATISKTVTFLAWQTPQISYTISRVNNFENTTNILANVNISSVNSKNSLQLLQYRTKQTSSSAWSDWASLTSGTTVQADFDNSSAWNFQIQAQDKFAAATVDYVLNKGMPIMFFDTQKISVGINKFPVNDNSLDVDIINGNPILTYDVMSVWDEKGYTIDFNDTYYFVYSSGIFTSNNKGVNSTTAYTRLKIDATNWSSSSTLIVNYTISSESGYDYGTCHATNSTSQPSYSTSTGRFIYVSGATTTSSGTYTLTKGLVWYIHLQYRKDSSQSSNNDIFKINDITF
jgi:hypothetical protein